MLKGLMKKFIGNTPDELTVGTIDKSDLDELWKIMHKVDELADEAHSVELHNKLHDTAKELLRILNNIY